MKNYIIALCLFLISFSFKAQQGKDGSPIIAASATVNVYTTLSVNTASASVTLNVASATGIAVGDLVYIIQMQGADVNAVREFWWLDSTSSDPIDASKPFGKVMNYNNCGNNEFAEITNVAGNVLTVSCGLKNSYDISGKVQVIRVPRYAALTINSGGNITCPAWNGSTGGIVAIEVKGATVINTGGKIDASGLGFRGGLTHLDTTYGGSKLGSDLRTEGALKGEGIAGDAGIYQTLYAAKYGYGAMANAGGGGCPNNAGGGGGANAGNFTARPWTGKGMPDITTSTTYTTAWNLEAGFSYSLTSCGGGKGGYSFSNSNQNPLTLAPGNTTWGGDNRRIYGGTGGEALDYSSGKIFMGGGGGAGDDNDKNASGGGNGGGIVYLLSYGTVSGAGQILSTGAAALNTNWNTAFGLIGDDGAGGGGGGGTVLINSVGNITLTNATPISVKGGAGGNYVAHTFSTVQNFGPGGGGGGGYAALTNTVTGTNVTGGTNGIAQNGGGNTTQVTTKFPPNGATKGDSGVKASLLTFYLTSTNYTICAGNSASLTVTANGTGIPGLVSYNWYNVSSGGSILFTGNPYNTGALTVGTYTFYAGTCPGTYRVPFVVTVLAAPTVTVTPSNTVVCANSAVTFTATGATSYTWSANAGSVTTATATATPTVATTYTVTGANGTCTDTKTITINTTANPTVTIAASNTLVCANSATTFTASGAASYTWSANAGSVTTSTATVNPSSNTTYTVTGVNGTCAPVTQTITVNTTPSPTISITASNTLVCAGSPVTFTASGAASYTWSANAGSVTTSTATVNPSSNTTYTVTGVNGTCAPVTQTITVNTTPSPTISITASNTLVCAGSPVTFTATGASSYTWSANAGSVTTSTTTVNPSSNTTYTVTGVSGTCPASTQTVAVNTTTSPTISITASNTLICAGSPVTFTASGATTYTWSANAGSVNTATATASPFVNTTYTVTGVNGTCPPVTQTVTINTTPSPTISITASNTLVCAGSPVTFTASGAGSYTWSANAGSVTTATATVNPSSNTTYTVTGVSGTCPAVTRTITVNTTPSPTISITASNTLVCVGSPVTFTASGAGSYTWSANAGSVTTSTTTVNPSSNTTYTVTGVSGTCAPVTQTVTVNTSASPTVSIAASNTLVCANSAVTFTASGASSYTWSANAGSVTTSTATANPSSNTTYTVTGVSGTCAPVTQTITVNTSASPTIAIAASNTLVCANSAVTFTASGASSYTWSANAGSVITSTATANPSSNTTYTVTGVSGTCPASTQTVTVNTTPSPTISITASSTLICAGSPVTFTASGGTTYTWSVNAGSVNTSTATASPSVNTTYTVTGVNGMCPPVDQTITINATPSPTISITASNTVVCAGSAVTFTASGATSYTWSANAGGVTTNTTTVNPSASTTYTVTGESGICPPVNQTITVNTSASPTVSIVASSTLVCENSIVTFTASGASSYTWSANAGSVNTATATANPSANTTYSVIGVSGTCAPFTQTITVNTIAQPTISIVASTDTICNGGAATFTASGATTYTWSANAGSVSTATASVSPAATDTYIVTGDNGGGCTSTQTVSLNVTANPTVSAVSSSTIICNGSAAILTAAGATSYTWSANAGSVTTATAAVTPSVTTIYTVTGENTGCSATQTVSVDVNNPPTQVDSVINPAACGSATGSYVINSVVGGTGPYQINFNNSGFTNISSFPYTVSTLSAGSYPVVIKDNIGCTYTTSLIINNSGGITKVDSAMSSASCNPSNNGSITLNSVTGGTAPYQVEVNGGGFNPIASFPFTISNLSAGTYTIVVKDVNLCQYTTLITVGSIGGITQVSSTSQSAVCIPPNSGSIDVTSVTGGTGPYQVSLDGGPLTTMSSFPYTLSGLTTGTYTMLVQDVAGCTNTTTVSVGTIAGPSAATDTTRSDTCSKNVGTLNVFNIIGGTPSYQYSLNGGAFQASGAFTGLATGLYTITVKDNNGCLFTQTDSVRSAGPTASPTITTSGATTFCQGGSVVLTSSSATGNTWSMGATTQTITVNAADTISVVVSQSGCALNSNTVIITVNPNPTVTINPTALTICDGSSTTLTASGASNYTWSVNAGSATTSTVSVSPSSTITPTIYSVSATDVNGCPGSATSTITVLPTPPNLVVNPDTFYYCLFQTVSALPTTAISGATLNWYDANMNPLTGAPTPVTNPAGTTTYYLTQSIGICSSAGKDSVKVIVIPGPNADFTSDPTSDNILAGQDVHFTPNQALSANFAYFWYFGDTNSHVDSSFLYSPTHAYANSGTYCPALTVYQTLTGCSDTKTYCIKILEGIIVTVPNVFTPNQDNINDVFSVKTEGISDLTCSIYDRWGIKLYEWTGIAGFWNGTDSKNGKTVSDGTYYYIIEATDVKKVNHKYQGYLQLLR